VSKNESLFARAQKIIPGGVNSPVRAFRAVGGTPRFIVRGEGSRIWDADGCEYLDYVGSWGPLVLGHADREVVAAVREAAGHGLSFGAPTERETEMAELLARFVPGLELVRLVSSGTEATMAALRLARGATGRSRIVKFEGCYHGHADSLLVKAGSGALTLGNPSSAGVTPETAAHTVVLDFNDLEGLDAAFHKLGDSIACAIVEPQLSTAQIRMWDANTPAARGSGRKHAGIARLSFVSSRIAEGTNRRTLVVETFHLKLHETRPCDVKSMQEPRQECAGSQRTGTVPVVETKTDTVNRNEKREPSSLFPAGFRRSASDLS